MNPVGMTPRQLNLMVFVQTYVRDHGYSPNYAEIAAGIGLASSLVLSDEGVAVAQRFAERSVPQGTAA